MQAYGVNTTNSRNGRLKIKQAHIDLLYNNSLRPSDAYMRQWTNHHWFDNGLSPGRHQAIIWNNAGLLLIEPLGTNVGEISIGIQTFSFKKMHLNMSYAKWRPFCLGLNVLNYQANLIPWHRMIQGWYLAWYLNRYQPTYQYITPNSNINDDFTCQHIVAQ